MARLKTPIHLHNGLLPALPKWCIGALIAVWVGAYIVYLVLEQTVVESPYQTALADLLHKETVRHQQKLDNQLTQLIRNIDKIANDPATLAVLLTPEKQATSWQKTARTMDTMPAQSRWLINAKAALPEAERLYLLKPKGDAFPLPGNFVAELLFEKALEGSKPPPQAAKTDQWNIYITRPIFKDKDVAGVLLVEVRPVLFQDSLQHAEGRINLIQSVDHFPDINFYNLGNGWKEEYSAALETQVPNWKIRFTASKQLVDQVHPNRTFFYSLTILLITAALVASLYLIQKTGVRPRATKKTSSRFNPKDDLFTQRVVRNADGTVEASAARTPAEGAQAIPSSALHDRRFPDHVFRDYDIRGKADSELTREFAAQLGKVLGTMALASGEKRLVVCSDGRKSSPALKTALGNGILSTGCDVLDIGEAPTPVMNFALSTMGDCSSGVMVTASHNPKGDNGFKIILRNRVLSSNEIQDLKHRMIAARFAKGEGKSHSLELHQRYINHIAEDIQLEGSLKVAIDCGNGIASVIAPALFRILGCKITELFTDVDGNFPNHDPDPTVAGNLQALIHTVVSKQLDLGLAFDGDGDRVVAITSTGRIVWPDELMMIFARDVVTRNPGADIIYDVKSTRRLGELIASYGGRPVMWKTGHAHMRNKVRESKAPLGGEFSGHIFFTDRWHGFDDGLYAAARLLEVLTLREQSLEDIVSTFPDVFSTEEIKIPIAEDRKVLFVDEFIGLGGFKNTHLVTIDGLRVEYAHGWGLIRPSNTSAALTLRFEAETADALEAIIADFRERLKSLDPTLPVVF